MRSITTIGVHRHLPDIVERLRKNAKWGLENAIGVRMTLIEAADEIERLREELKK